MCDRENKINIESVPKMASGTCEMLYCFILKAMSFTIVHVSPHFIVECNVTMATLTLLTCNDPEQGPRKRTIVMLDNVRTPMHYTG